MSCKTKNHSLGRAIIKDRFKSSRKKHGTSNRHTTELDDGYDWSRLNGISVTEENALERFLTEATLADHDFRAEKINATLVSETTCLPTLEELKRTREIQDEHRKSLKIPRRPHWEETTTAEELKRMEEEAFLDWRRNLSHLSEVEGIVITPYEKNIDFWRQLWRVIERSDVVVQIVDARNPLLFRCEDLEKYVKEVNKEKINVILINKADFLTAKQRKSWARYFDSINCKVIFWSAVQELNKMKEEPFPLPEVAEEEDDDDSEDEDEEEEDEGDDERDVDEGEKDEDEEERDVDEDGEDTDDSLDVPEDDENSPSVVDEEERAEEETCKGRNNPNILTVDELIAKFRSICDHVHSSDSEDAVTTIGLVGYPNVGKSSTLNALLTRKTALTENHDKKNYQVPVSATPGRTKHFQTFYLDKTLMLCDCPGLVMPTFVATKAEMITNGILSIDHMTDFVPPVSIICEHIPRNVLELNYGIMIPLPKEDEDPDRYPTAYELLMSYACIRGYFTHKGVPDCQRAARYILKDYVNGKLCYRQCPPTTNETEFGSAPNPSKSRKIKKENLDSGTISDVSKSVKPISEVDKAFFNQKSTIVGSKGIRGVVGFTRKEGYVHHHSSGPDATTDSLAGSVSSLNGKPWKRHNNVNKKEKLRRKHRPLDD